MKSCTKCKVVRPFTDFAPNKLTKDKLQSWCRKCKNAHDAARKANDLEYKARRREMYKSEAYKQKRKGYMATEKGRQIVKENRRQQKADLARRRNYRAFYKLKAQSRVPGWVLPKDLLPFYQLAETLGHDYTIDHIIPLRSKVVCGLHCAENLQILTHAANHLKGTSLFEAWWEAGVKP